MYVRVLMNNLYQTTNNVDALMHTNYDIKFYNKMKLCGVYTILESMYVYSCYEIQSAGIENMQVHYCAPLVKVFLLKSMCIEINAHVCFRDIMCTRNCNA